MAEKSCKDCAHSGVNVAGQMECRRFPPQVGFLTQINPDSGDAFTVNASAYPLISAFPCSEHRVKIHIAKELPNAG